MISDLPVESVNGQSEWAWNERHSTDSSPRSRSTQRAPARRPGRTDSDGSLEEQTAAQQEIRRLEAELDRKEQHLQHVIEQYEQLLEEKNRRIADRERSESESARLSTFRSVLRRYVAGRE
ncbi:hypothetical protein [Halorubrum sp. DTA46]|uniref:hypothetical protein n=1 Tax=Halorubrum sp. DTA46 TaxID=3402162 RepID=UPI003AAAC0C9